MAKMTPVERLIASAKGEEPDRVPVSIIVGAWAWAQVYGRDSFLDLGLDAKKTANVMVWCAKKLGSDTVGIPLYDAQLLEAIVEASGIKSYPIPRFKEFIPGHPHRLYEGDPLKDALYGNPLVKTLEDAERLVPADPYRHGRLPIMLEAVELARKELKDEWGIGGFYAHPMGLIGSLMGWTQMFIAVKKDPELVKRLGDIAIKTSYEWTKALIEHGVVSLATHSTLPAWMGSKTFLENPMWEYLDHPPELAPRIWREFHVGTSLHPCTVGPWEQGIEIWKKWLDHTLSFLMPEYGGADALARAKEQLAPATVSGNVHPIDVMLWGSPADVELACRELIKKCAPGGRFILAPGCDLPIGVPLGNVKAMIDSVEKYGKYPIKL